MRASRLVRTLSVTPIADMRKIGVSATWIKCAISIDWIAVALVESGVETSRPPRGCRGVDRGYYFGGVAGAAGAAGVVDPAAPVDPLAPAVPVAPVVPVVPPFFLLDGFLVELVFAAVFVDAVAVEAAAAGAPGVAGVSAAIAPAAIPMVNKAEVIKVPDIFMGSPAVV
jgi:hypothetical protein